MGSSHSLSSFKSPLLALIVGLAAAISGCARSANPEAYNGTREWGGCAAIGALTGAVVGAGIGLGISAATAGTRHQTVSTTTQCPPGTNLQQIGQATCGAIGIDAPPSPAIVTTRAHSSTNKYIAPIAALPGAIIGAIVGHYLCDPIFHSPNSAYPPPPPPPAPTADSATQSSAPSSDSSSSTTGQTNLTPQEKSEITAQ